MDINSALTIAILVLFIIFFILLMRWYTDIKNSISTLKGSAKELVEVLNELIIDDSEQAIQKPHTED